MECVCLDGDGVVLSVGLEKEESREESVRLCSERSSFEPKGQSFALP